MKAENMHKSVFWVVMLTFTTLVFSHYCLMAIKLPHGFVPPCLFKHRHPSNPNNIHISDDSSKEMKHQHSSIGSNFCPAPNEPNLEYETQTFGK